MWKKIDISMEQISTGHIEKIMKQLIVLFYAIPDIKGIAIFSSPLTLEGKSLYFTPKAVDVYATIIEAYGGIKCEPPPKQWDPNDWTERTGFLAGDKSSYTMLPGELTEPPVF